MDEKTIKIIFYTIIVAVIIWALITTRKSKNSMIDKITEQSVTIQSNNFLIEQNQKIIEQNRQLKEENKYLKEQNERIIFLLKTISDKLEYIDKRWKNEHNKQS